MDKLKRKRIAIIHITLLITVISSVLTWLLVYSFITYPEQTLKVLKSAGVAILCVISFALFMCFMIFTIECLQEVGWMENDYDRVFLKRSRRE